MAEAAEKEAPKVEEEKQEPQKPKRKIDFLGIAIFLFVLINIGVVFGLGHYLQQLWNELHALQVELNDIKSKPSDDETIDKNSFGEEPEPQELGILYPIESFLVNISSGQGTKFLQIQLELEIIDPAVEDEIAKKKPAIRDSIIVLLSSRTYEELRNPSGMTKLREDLVKSINNILITGKIKAVYFTQFHFN